MPHSTNSNAFPAEHLRRQFPALVRKPQGIFFDNAAGAQIPQRAFDAVQRHLLEHNVQRGGRYAESVAVDAAIHRARRRVGYLLNARRPEEVAFGMNATSFIRILSLAIGQTLQSRNEIIVTDLDHEANIATWLALQAMGARIVWWRMRDDGTLHTDDLRQVLSHRTRLVACTVASNAIGTLVDVRAAADLAHAVGAQILLDCVHYGPHAVIDVQEFDCDFLVCSGYKIFAPHMGFMWGRYELLKSLPTFREDFVPDEPPGKIEAGTFVYENVAGMDAAVEYLRDVGRQARSLPPAESDEGFRMDLVAALDSIRRYEQHLSQRLLEALAGAGACIYGVSDPAKVEQRVPTVCFNLPGVPPARLSQAMAAADISIRDGHLYVPRLMRRFGLDLDQGAARVSLVHYNTDDEVTRFAEVLNTVR